MNHGKSPEAGTLTDPEKGRKDQRDREG